MGKRQRRATSARDPACCPGAAEHDETSIAALCKSKGKGESSRGKAVENSSNAVNVGSERTTRSKARRRATALSGPGPEAEDGPASPELPMELFLHVLTFLPHNEQALSGRLTCKDAAARLSTPSQCTVHCGQHLPEHAADEGWQQQQLSHRLAFKHKLRLLSVAAASGCVANVRLAWGVLRPCLFPELMSWEEDSQYPYAEDLDLDDPGTAAVKAGHTNTIAWLLANGCPLPRDLILGGAPQHCSLEALQELLRLVCEPGDPPAPPPHVCLTYCVCAAAQSRTPDACAKVCWLLGRHACTANPGFLERALVSASKAGRFDVLRQLYDTLYVLADHQRHQSMLCALLENALMHADLAVADWLVDERRLRLPTNGAGGNAAKLWGVAAQSGSVDALRWLQSRGVPAQQGAMVPAVRSGRLDAVRFLLEECGLLEELQLQYHAVMTGSLDLAAWLWQRGSLVPAHVYEAAAVSGSVAMVEWLLREVRCPRDERDVFRMLSNWPRSRPVRSSGDGNGSSASTGAAGGGATGLLRALQLLAEAGFGLGKLSKWHIGNMAEFGDVELARWVLQQSGSFQCAMGPILQKWPEGGAPGAQLLDAVRMVLESGGSPGSSREAEQAARRGDLEVLQLLHEQEGVRLGREVWAAAAEGGCEAVLEWLAAVGCRVGTDAAQDPYLVAGRRGDRGTLCTLRRLGVPWGHRGVLRTAVDMGVSLPVVRWMVETGAPWDGAAVAKAVEAARRQGREHEATALWLEEQGAAREGKGAGPVGGKGTGGKRRR